jgi:uncharacterized membrane protein
MSDESMSPSSDDKLWAALAYVFSPLIPIILMLMDEKKERPFIRAHNAQALVLGIITIVTSAFCIGILVWLYSLYCAFQAYQGEEVEVPIVTNFVKGQGWA